MQLLSYIKEYWVIITALCSILTYIVLQIIALRNGIKALLHDRIIQKCEYLIKRNYVTSDDLEELEYMNKPYKALNGNGTVEIMLREVHKLPKR